MTTRDTAAPPTQPIVLVPACNREIADHPFHVAGKKYVDAVRLAGCMPLIVPTARPEEIEALLDLADGVLLTGSKSNVHPSHFDEPVHDDQLPLDTDRDAWTLPLIRRVVARGQPLLGICRGAQETNVALGGSLFQAVHAEVGPVGPHADHRAPDGQPPEVQYQPAHAVQVLPGGLLAGILPHRDFQVNSLHGQAVRQLAAGLRVEARAPDGVIEAFSVAHGQGFQLCIQWHPEWLAAGNPQSMAILHAFGDACRAWRQRRQGVPAHRTPIP
jgi:putative glutamine amidotransferase